MKVVDRLVELGETWAAAEPGGVRSFGIWTVFVLALGTDARHLPNAQASWTRESMPVMAVNDGDYLEELAQVEAEFERNRLRNALHGVVRGRHSVVEASEA